MIECVGDYDARPNSLTCDLWVREDGGDSWPSKIVLFILHTKPHKPGYRADWSAWIKVAGETYRVHATMEAIAAAPRALHAVPPEGGDA